MQDKQASCGSIQRCKDTKKQADTSLKAATMAQLAMYQPFKHAIQLCMNNIPFTSV
ncbi:MAG: hypothetical protein ACTHJ0_02585 [Flavipsychrobacter sp.]